MSNQDFPWWRGGVIYQIYPRSFKDTNGDGIGDLKGITEKLPYVASLGVDAVWISPFMKSPQKDFGYDVSDYCAIDPMFGVMDDFKVMMKTAHELNLKIIIDFKKAVRHGTIQRRIGMFGSTQNQTAHRPPTGFRYSAGRHGNMIHGAGNITFTIFFVNNQI
jgi:1,4-alpha-glucan branching enzyme